MKINWTKSILIVSIFCIAFAGCGVVPGKEIPEEIKKVGIKVGKAKVKKSIVFEAQSKGVVRTLFDEILGNERSRQSSVSSWLTGFEDIKGIDGKIVVSSSFGVFVLSKDGKVLKQSLLEVPKSKVIVPVLGEQETNSSTFGGLKIFNRKNGDFGVFHESAGTGLTVFESEGNIALRIVDKPMDLSDVFDSEAQQQSMEEAEWVTGVVALDMDGDGADELAVSRKNIGLTLYDSDFKKLFTLKGEGYEDVTPIRFGSSKKETLVWDYKFSVSLDGNKEELSEKIPINISVLLQRKGEDGKTDVFDCRDRDGKISCESRSTTLTRNAPLSLIKKESETIKVGEYTITSDSHSFYLNDVKEFDLDGKRMMVALGSFLFDRSNLYFYDEDGKLIYHEVLEGEAKSLDVSKDKDGKPEIWVVSGKRVLRYLF